MNLAATAPTALAGAEVVSVPPTTEEAAPRIQQRNDNSNPQQGTGAPRVQSNIAPALVAEALPVRPTMKIPPNKKDSRKLFVGGLPSDVTSEEFRTFFEQFGEVLDSVVMLDRLNGRSRGFGFVTYVDSSVALKLLQAGNGGVQLAPDQPLVGRLEMRGKMVEVKSAEPKEYQNGPRRYSNRAMHSVMNRPHYGTPMHADPNMMMYGAHMDYSYQQSYYAPPVVGGYMPPMMYHHQLAYPSAHHVYHQDHHHHHHHTALPPHVSPVEAGPGVPPTLVPGSPVEAIPQQHAPVEMQVTTAATSTGYAAAVLPFGPHHNHAHPAPYQQGSTMHPAAPGLPVRESEDGVESG